MSGGAACSATMVSSSPLIFPRQSHSPCGRVFGKMAHSERYGKQVAKNIPGNKHQPIFEAGIRYFS